MCLKLIYTFIFKPTAVAFIVGSASACLALLLLYLWTSYESSLSATFSECSHYQIHPFSTHSNVIIKFSSELITQLKENPNLPQCFHAVIENRWQLV